MPARDYISVLTTYHVVLTLLAFDDISLGSDSLWRQSVDNVYKPFFGLSF